MEQNLNCVLTGVKHGRVLEQSQTIGSIGASIPNLTDSTAIASTHHLRGNGMAKRKIEFAGVSCIETERLVNVRIPEVLTVDSRHRMFQL